MIQFLLTDAFLLSQSFADLPIVQKNLCIYSEPTVTIIRCLRIFEYFRHAYMYLNFHFIWKKSAPIFFWSKILPLCFFLTPGNYLDIPTLLLTNRIFVISAKQNTYLSIYFLIEIVKRIVYLLSIRT